MDGFRDIALPDAVAQTPQTWAWALLFAIVIVAGVVALRFYLRYRRANRYRGLALAELDSIRERNAWGELPVLVKRVALQAWPREQVAGRTGADWIAFLDRSYGGGGFERLYDGDAATARVVGEWIREHHA